MRQLMRGQVAVNKKHLIEFLNVIQAHINGMDEIMKEPSTVERGRKISKHMNALQFQIHTIQHFDLGIDLKKLGSKLLPNSEQAP